MTVTCSRLAALLAVSFCLTPCFLTPAFAADADPTPQASKCPGKEVFSWVLTAEGVDVEYPTEDLFNQAFNQTVLDATTRGQPPPPKPDVATARKSHCPGEVPAQWMAQSTVQMVDLPQAPYGIYPFWQSARDTLKIDFNVVQRIGWYGAAFTSSGKVEMPPELKPDSVASRDVGIARRFHAGVDLVFYLQKKPNETWTTLVEGLSNKTRDPSFVTLAKNIADAAGQPLTGFTNRYQRYLLLPALRSAPTAWDGVTLFLDGFPFDDRNALGFLDSLLKALREQLNAKASAAHSSRRLALNLVVPFASLVADRNAVQADDRNAVQAGDKNSEQTTPGCLASGTALTICSLSQFVPRMPDGVAESKPGERGNDVVDRFIVFLPQPVSETKKELRQSIENAITQKAEGAVMKDFPKVSIAAWRTQVLRRTVCVLAPGTWAWKGAYTDAGMQFVDDMIYCEDNLRTVGFWPLPVYGKDNAALIGATRAVFGTYFGHSFQSRIALWVEGKIGPDPVNFVGEHRRELGLFVEAILVLLALLAIGAWLFFEVELFCRRYFFWLLAAGLVAFAVGSVMLFLDPVLTRYAAWIYGGTAIAAVVGPALRQIIVSRLERNLP